MTLSKCHSDHMKVGPNMMKVTLKFNADEMYLVHHLTHKFAEGKPCVAEFLKVMALHAIKENFLQAPQQEAETK